jgi:endonuclease/exonuclease/phosphatase family metal-dependent hydrolase
LAETADHLLSLDFAHRLDAVCLQEVCWWRQGGGTSSINMLAEALDMKPAVARHPVPNGSWWEAVVVFSRWPMVRLRKRIISFHRSYLEVRLMHPELPGVNVGSVHISSWSPEWRAKEVDRLKRLASRQRAVLAGDFNLTPGDEAMVRLGEFFRSDDSTEPTCGRRKIDHVLASKELSVTERVLDKGPSDHRPVLAQISPASCGGLQML